MIHYHHHASCRPKIMISRPALKNTIICVIACTICVLYKLWYCVCTIKVQDDKCSLDVKFTNGLGPSGYHRPIKLLAYIGLYSNQLKIGLYNSIGYSSKALYYVDVCRDEFKICSELCCRYRPRDEIFVANRPLCVLLFRFAERKAENWQVPMSLFPRSFCSLGYPL